MVHKSVFERIHHFISVSFAIIFITLSIGYPVDIRCELVQDSCLDLSNETNPTITVPSNTTRIDKNGIGICLPFLKTYKAVDLVFIIDMSGSMVRTDPEKLVSPASIAALNLIDSLSPNSNVGFMGFSNGVCDGVQKNIDSNKGKGKKYEDKADTRVFPASLRSPGHKDTLLDPMTFSPDNFITDCGALHSKGFGTNYYRPFLLGEEWMKQMDTPNKKIFIFLTDGGNNTEKPEYQEMLARVDSTNFPIVHAIFVNQGQNPDLELMTQKTGGLYAQVEDFTNVKDVMMTMVGASLIPNSPDKTTIFKNGQVIGETVIHTNVISTYFQAGITRDVSLDLGSNLISVTSNTSDFGVVKNNVTIQVNGPAETSTGVKELPGTNLFKTACYEVSKLIPMDKNYINPIQQLGAYHETGFGIALVTPADDIDAVANVTGVGDAENTGLDSVMNGYRGITAFAHSNLKTPKNNIVEGLVGETLLLSWVHPHDPRDTASAVLPIYDNRADTTEILFQDLQGNPITEIKDLGGKKFKLVVMDNKAVKAFLVQLATTHGDILMVEVQPVAPKTFEAFVQFDFATAVNPANQIIEGLFNPESADNKTIVIAKVKKAEKGLLLRKIYVPIEKAWIIDNNEDGSADMVFIRFVQNIHALPENVSDIHWPSNTTLPGKRAPAAAATPTVNPLSFVGNDNSLVLADLSQDQFAFGATNASATSPPTLTLPDGQIEIIQDSVKPALLFIEKKPSNFGRYIRKSDSVIVHYPDTLILTLSEPIVLVAGVVEPWKSLLTVEKGGVPVPIELLSQPVPLTPDGLTFLVTVENKPGAQIVMVGDEVSLNPNGPYRDLKSNSPSKRKAAVTGLDGKKTGFVSAWRGGEVTGDKIVTTSFDKELLIPVIDDITGEIDGAIPASEVQEWVPPVGLDRGVIDINKQKPPACVADNNTPALFPSNCLASRLILTGPTEGKYIAEVMIYNNVGSFIRYLEQAFGYCGELQNLARVSESGLIMNDIVWDMKNSEGELVGNGVYLWIIRLKYASGAIKERFYKMGVARKEEFLYNNCISNL